MNERQLRKLFDLVVLLKSSTAFNLVLFGKEGDLVLAERLLRNIQMAAVNRVIGDIDELLDRQTTW